MLLEQVNQVQQIHTAGSTELLRTTHTLKAWKESGMSRDDLTQGDMRTHKIRAQVVIRTMDSSLLDCLQGKGELVLFLVTN